MLQNHVQAFTVPPAKTWNGITTSRFMAVTYRMMLDLSMKPTANSFASVKGGLTILLKNIGLAGSRIVQPNVETGNVKLPAGSVIVFMATNLAQAGHACVIKNGLVVGGYNQTNWFSTPGAEAQYSEHNLGTDLAWVDRTSPLTRRRVQTTGELSTTDYYLYATPQDVALKQLRDAFG